jgi:hydroxymethylbilane synthase
MLLRLATRDSALALWQARHVAAALRRAWPGLRTVLVPLTAGADRDLITPLYGMGGAGVFAKEVHAAVLAGHADCGVHSCKDLPTAVPAGLTPPVLLRRADPRDALLGAASLAALPPGARVGSSSLRRRAQLLAYRPDLICVDLRGNVPTRLRKLKERQVDATVLALAGLSRLDLARSSRAVALDPVAEMVPAVAQGALAVDCRAGDARTRRLLSVLTHRPTQLAVGIERAVLAGLRGGCSLPLGCLVRRAGLGWRLDACLARDGQPLRRIELHGPAAGLAERALAALE